MWELLVGRIDEDGERRVLVLRKIFFCGVFREIVERTAGIRVFGRENRRISCEFVNDQLSLETASRKRQGSRNVG